MEGIEPVRLEALMTHRDWVRRVARALAADSHGAADLEQELWVKVLEKPPRIRGSVRGWLAATLRNAFLNDRRGDSRRAARERSASVAEARPSAADLVADAEAVRRLMGEVLELAEPYRTTVLLRFYEDLPPGAVADRMDVPVETVRTRLRRAMALLRDRLDAGRGGEGWLAALAPIAGVRIDAGAAAGSSGTAMSGALGGAVMGAKATVVASVGLGIAAGFLGGLLSSSGSSVNSPDLVRRIESLETSGSRGATDAAAPDRAAPDSSTSARLVEQERRIRSLETEVAAVRKSNEELRAARAAGVPESAASPRPFSELSTEELLAEIRRLGGLRYRTQEENRAGKEKIVQACDALLERTIDSPQRILALTAKGTAHVQMGDADRGEAALGEVVRLAGPTSSDGRNATFQLAIAASVRKDNRRASEILQGLARQSDSTSADQAKLRYMAASYLAVEDRAAALVELKEIVREFGASEDKGVLHTVAEARKEIAKLEKAGE